ncbi:Serine/threonine-protein phosphatase PGAM5, mitochondrial [Lamellibrachia satsuma]|nr:Serine/threonine-protein phosphatase PGAM5, mitochondrial [Lamellibrachia satsuma]
MSWQKSSGAFRVICGVVIGAGTAWVIQKNKDDDHPKVQVNKAASTGQNFLPLQKVLASWTTNFSPSMPWDNNWDRMDPKSLEKPPKNKKSVDENNNETEKPTKPTARRHLLLIRHGQYEQEARSDLDRKLTSLGLKQAEVTGQRLKALNLPYTTVIHSSMTRAQETAKQIHQYILPQDDMKQCDLLREGAPIPPEPPIGHWRPEANQFYQDGARIEAAFRKYFHRASVSQTSDSYEVVVCHANVIRYFVCRALQFPPEAWLRMSLYNGSITWVTISPSGRVSLRTLGDAGHMAPDMLTTS